LVFRWNLILFVYDFYFDVVDAKSHVSPHLLPSIPLLSSLFPSPSRHFYFYFSLTKHQRVAIAIRRALIPSNVSFRLVSICLALSPPSLTPTPYLPSLTRPPRRLPFQVFLHPRAHGKKVPSAQKSMLPNGKLDRGLRVRLI